MTYTFKCTNDECNTTFEVNLKVEDRDKPENLMVCSKCGGLVKREIDKPSGIVCRWT